MDKAFNVYIMFFITNLILIVPGICQVVSFSRHPESDDFPLFYEQHAADILIDELDDEVVKISAKMLAQDIAKVTGKSPSIKSSSEVNSDHVIILGSINKNRLIKKLIANSKLDIDSINGQWEAGLMMTVQNPFPNVRSALIITGGDRRGVAYAAMNISRSIGVSPWVWWADVVPQSREGIIIDGGVYHFKSPSVKYRGIFLNDELWGLRQWAAKTQDTVYKDMGPKAYEKVFELMLRLKANYLWPARHTAFNEKPENALIADKYAIVRGGAHNSPILGNARKEWIVDERGEYNYATNSQQVLNFWDDNLEKFGKYENVYTIGMRGVGDRGMEGGEGIDKSVELTSKIIEDQRHLLSSKLDKEITSIPQIFVAYKEVLDIYDHGLNLPDDVTIVWPDDNYGYIKRLPDPMEEGRSGGSGVYYHLSYLGRPTDYLLLSTTPPTLIWEELLKAYEFNVRNMWVINVGDIKPAEYEWQFSMDLAWDANDFGYNRIQDHLVNWMTTCFGESIGKEAADIKNEFYRLAFQRKPEFMGWNRLEPRTPVIDTEFSFINYHEAELRLEDYNSLQLKTEKLYQKVEGQLKPAFFQLVYYPTVMASLMNKKFLVAQKNRWYADQGRSLTNELADDVKAYHDSLLMLTEQYEELNNDKWQDMASYDDIPFETYKMPPIKRIKLEQGINWDIWTQGNSKGEISQQLPIFSRGDDEQFYFEIYNKSSSEIKWEANVSHSWIHLSKNKGEMISQDRIYVNIDWPGVNDARVSGEIQISVQNETKTVSLVALNEEFEIRNSYFYERNGVVAINAENYHHFTQIGDYKWEILENLGITNKVVGAFPLTNKPIDHEWNVSENASKLSYDFISRGSGWVDVSSFTLPTHVINKYRGTKYGISIDDGPPLIIDFATKDRSEEWKQNVTRNTAIKTTRHFIQNPGKHTLNVWMIDTGVYFDKFIVDFGGLKESYLGPEETHD